MAQRHAREASMSETPIPDAQANQDIAAKIDLWLREIEMCGYAYSGDSKETRFQPWPDGEVVKRCRMRAHLIRVYLALLSGQQESAEGIANIENSPGTLAYFYYHVYVDCEAA
jgi:hypothetical protein